MIKSEKILSILNGGSHGDNTSPTTNLFIGLFVGMKPDLLGIHTAIYILLHVYDETLIMCLKQNKCIQLIIDNKSPMRRQKISIHQLTSCNCT